MSPTQPSVQPRKDRVKPPLLMRRLRGRPGGNSCLSWQLRSAGTKPSWGSGSFPHPLFSLGWSWCLPLKGFISMLMRLRRWAILFSSKNSISPFLALWAYLSDLDALCLIKTVFVFSFSSAPSTSGQSLPLPPGAHCFPGPLFPAPPALWAPLRAGQLEFFLLCFGLWGGGEVCVGNH